MATLEDAKPTVRLHSLHGFYHIERHDLCSYPLLTSSFYQPHLDERGKEGLSIKAEINHLTIEAFDL